MIEELTRKLRSTLLGNGTLTNLIGGSGVYLLRAPQGAVYPYVTFFPVDETPIHLHEGSNTPSQIEDTVWQFSMFHTRAVGLASVHAELKASFDDQNLSLATLTEIRLLRQPAGPLLVDHDEEAGSILHQFQEYRVYVI